jgi:hypothetical protein
LTEKYRTAIQITPDRQVSISNIGEVASVAIATKDKNEKIDIPIKRFFIANGSLSLLFCLLEAHS